MAALLMHHKVADFATWVKVFEEHKALRQQNGVTNSSVWQAADDPNHVFVLQEGFDASKAQAFAQSPELKAAMQKAGVLGMPEVTLLADGQKFPH